MKKLFKTGLLLSSLFLVTSCGGGSEGGTQGGGSKEYNITYEQNSYISIKNLAEKAKEGDNVTFSITKEYETVHIKDVKFNTTSCTLEGDKYSFTMPSEDVKISVDFDFKETTINGIAAFEGHNEIAPFNESTDFVDYDRVLHVNLTTNNMTILKKEFVSTNETVIPNNAIKFKENINHGSGLITSVDVLVDPTLIAPGETNLLLKFENGNVVPVQKGELCLKITVKEFGTIDFEQYEPTLNFRNLDNSKEYLLRVFDNDYYPGTVLKSFTDYAVTDASEAIKLAVYKDHSYSFLLCEGNEIDHSKKVAVEVQTSGDATVGEYDYVTFTSSDATVTLRA